MGTLIDNRWYDTLGDEWWDPRGRMGLLQQINPARAAYLRTVCARAMGRGTPEGGALRGLRVLDVGCGGGYLAEAFAREGASVSGVDLSTTSIEAARRHAARAGLSIEYHVASAHLLPYPGAAFDVVLCTDMLEHVADHLEAVIAEQTRVLRTGGVLGFETVNRTWQARVVLIWLGERLLRLAPPHLHDARLFIRPAELAACLARYDVHVVETHGMVPARHSLLFLAGWLLRRESGGFRLDNDHAISYIGYGLKRPRGS